MRCGLRTSSTSVEPDYPSWKQSRLPATASGCVAERPLKMVRDFARWEEPISPHIIGRYHTVKTAFALSLAGPALNPKIGRAAHLIFFR